MRDKLNYLYTWHMKQTLRYNYIDLAKAIGKRNYVLPSGKQVDILENTQNNQLLGSVLNIGPNFTIFGNVQNWETIFVSEGCEKVTGYTCEEAMLLGPQLLVQFTHPEDYPVAMETNKRALEVLFQAEPEDRPFITCIFYYRGIHRDGSIKNIQQHVLPTAFDLAGNPFIFANVITDISHLQLPQIPRTVLIDHKRNESKLIEPGLPFVEGERLRISARENEVLRLLASGHTTKEIGDKLGITFHTAATYRKRLLAKTCVKNTTELINFSIIHSLL
jgi:DNA-binding CsgD family transcriptional regulator